MSKKEVSPRQKLKNLIEEMLNEYSMWKNIYENGGSDPFWSDGSNLYLIRNHIINYKRDIKELCDMMGIQLPDKYRMPLPDEVPDNYMAVPDKIKKNAAAAYKIYSSTDVFEKLQDVVKSTKKEFRYIVLNAINCKFSCKRMIVSGDLVGMRRFYPERAQDDIKDAQEVLQRCDIYESSTQLSLF